MDPPIMKKNCRVAYSPTPPVSSLLSPFSLSFLRILTLHSPPPHQSPPSFSLPFPSLSFPSMCSSFPAISHSSSSPMSPPSETLTLILRHLLPLVLAASLSVKALTPRWRNLRAKLLLLQTNLAESSAAPNSLSNPLFVDLLSSLLATLNKLHSLSSRCLDASLPAGRLLLQSDLDIAASSLSHHIQDLSLLLKSGLLTRERESPNAIILSLPTPAASKADLTLFINDAFARLQIGALDIKLKALESLLELLNSDPGKLSPLIASEGDITCLLRLLDSSTSHSHLVDRALSVISLLSTSSASSCHTIFNEGGLGPLLRLIESGTAAGRNRAAAAVEAITSDPSRAWACSAYGGITVLINACRPGSSTPSLKSLAVSCLKNVSSLEDVQILIFEEGGIPVLIDILTHATIDAQRSSAFCLYSLGSSGGDEIRASIVQQSGLTRLLQILHATSDQELQENTLRAIHALSFLPSASKSLSSSPHFFSRLTDFISNKTRSTLSVQQISASLIASLSPSDDLKKSMLPCMAPLVRMLETSKPVLIQETASKALLSLLDLKSNRKELIKDEKSLTRLVKLLDPCNDQVSKRPVVNVVLALTSVGGNGARKRLMENGGVQFLQKLAESEVAGAKKALQRISGNRIKNLFSFK